jgi:hypothetical protein
MRKLVFLSALIILLVYTNCLLADSVKICDLIKDALSYDGKRVVVGGEAVGHLMKRGDFIWVNINDGTNALGIWTTFDLAKDIRYLGKHSITGDKLRAEGIFHLKCPSHGGDTDMHADKITLIERGSPRVLTHDPQKVNIIIFLTAILACLYIIKILKRTR